MQRRHDSIIGVNAWRWESGLQTYCDPDLETPDGWCVFEQDGDLNVDFASEAKALAFAETLGGEIRVY